MPEDEPEVSVLVATYNQARYIEECLASIVAQDHPDFEVVVTDDGSTDDTVAIVKRFAARHPNVRLVTSPSNTGVTANVNRGLRACRGRFIAAIGGDDVAYPGKLSLQAKLMRERPAVVICYHDVKVFFDDGSRPPSKFSEFRRPREGTAKDLVRHGNFIVGSSPMLRRAAIPPEGAPEELAVVSDWFLQIQMARQGQIAYIPQVLVGYRRHGDSVLMRKMGQSDPLRTLALVHERFPELSRHARWRRGELLRQEAKQAALQDPDRARLLARQALRQRQFWRPRKLAWVVLAATGFLPSLRRLRNQTKPETRP